MKSVAIRFLAVSIISIFAVAIFAGQDETENALRTALGDSQYDACGLDKLTPQEQEELLALWNPAPSHSYIEESAIRYFYREGWDRVEILGYRNIDVGGRGFPKDYLIAYRKSNTHILEPSMIADTLSPGEYWAKIQLSRWQILCPDGKVSEFWAKD